MHLHAIVIPCFNEALRLKVDEYRVFLESAPDTIICFVNDGSTDNTIQILHLLKDHYPAQIHLIENETNLGKSEAVRRGIQAMLKERETQYVGFLDADLSTDFHQYSQMLATIQNENLVMVFASRNKGKGNNIHYTPFRYWAGRIARFVIKGIIQLPVNDTQCGAKIFSRDAATICFDKSFETRWLFDVEIFLRLKKNIGSSLILHRIKACHLQHWAQAPDSKFRFVDMLQIPVQFLKIIAAY